MKKENWISSYDKWVEVVRRTKKKNMKAARTNWKLAIEQAETILNAIIEQGKELGYYKEDNDA